MWTKMLDRLEEFFRHPLFRQLITQLSSLALQVLAAHIARGMSRSAWQQPAETWT